MRVSGAFRALTEGRSPPAEWKDEFRHYQGKNFSFGPLTGELALRYIGRVSRSTCFQRLMRSISRFPIKHRIRKVLACYRGHLAL